VVYGGLETGIIVAAVGLETGLGGAVLTIGGERWKRKGEEEKVWEGAKWGVHSGNQNIQSMGCKKRDSVRLSLTNKVRA